MSQPPSTYANSLAELLRQQAVPASGGLGLMSIAAQHAGSQPIGLRAAPGGQASELASMGIRAETPRWLYVAKRFTGFIENLGLTDAQVADGETKFKGVVSCLNAAYYGTNSETDHAFYIGSWAKQTRIRPPRDVDLYFLLPPEVYHRFEKYSGNKQSALLQEVRGRLLASYPLSDINGDGPVVLAGFWSFTVEVVPAFALAEERTYWVPKTQDGGSYQTTKPLHEVDAINAADLRLNSNARRLIRMLKCWQANCNVELRSFYLELLAVEFLDQWAYKQHSYFFYDWMCRDFFQWLTTKTNSFVLAPGTYEVLWIGDAWKSKAETALGRAKKACEFERDNKEGDAGDEWRKIFGGDIPKWA